MVLVTRPIHWETLPAGVIFSLRLNWCQYFDQLCLHTKAFQYDAQANYGGGAFKSSDRLFGVFRYGKQVRKLTPRLFSQLLKAADNV